ncbi:hypothetical protein A3A74_04275 [Candidatus Roizmanbacteria bacterium RIFCSPLOWO2_01_FULL_35_13]|uniref:Uncharacterized protein n=1 Tax=Candidatus Roizmanbacteria bacterium RIFCSPLOWO2_01_FULL_35_13 TaxID=1802055 RepID=A0A1F7IB94_9BACT|nr:MAG: hypothetical protein A3A74_04275 [Candidatus Roizmanbacteria bacterium RIFCSPLOWO2_01_FULL_35_13]
MILTFTFAKTFKVISSIFADLTAASIITVFVSSSLIMLISRIGISIILFIIAIFFEHKS